MTSCSTTRPQPNPTPPQRLHGAATSTAPARRNAIAALRCAYFAQAGESAARYHVTFERVLLHLWDARQANRCLLLRSVIHVDDLVHAIACVDEIGLAWADLAERYERALIRRCRGGQDEIEATLRVRRLFADLRRRNHEAPWDSAPSMHGYCGARPLRNWLADRLNAVLAREPLVNRAGQSLAPDRRLISPHQGAPRGSLIQLQRFQSSGSLHFCILQLPPTPQPRRVRTAASASASFEG